MKYSFSENITEQIILINTKKQFKFINRISYLYIYNLILFFMKNVFRGILFFLLIIILSAIAVPYFFKDKIIQLAYRQIEKQVNAKVHIESVNLSILRNISNFPDIALSFDDVSLVGNDEFEGDTLLNLGKLKASLDIMSVIKGDTYKIETIELKDVDVDAIVNKNGQQNWNILKETNTDTTESSPFKLVLNKLILDNVNINYDDFTNGDKLKIENIQHKGKGDFSSEIFDYISKTTIGKISLKQGLVKYLSNATLNFDSKININQNENKYSFKDAKLTLNDLSLLFNGFVQNLEDKINLDIQFEADKTSFKSILSMIPAIYTKDFDNLKTSGNLVLNGKINGFLQGENYPEFSLNLNIDNGKFQYPDLPASVNDVFVNANIAHTQGNLDRTIIDIPKLNFKMGTEPVTAKLKIATPISDPNVDLTAKGNLNLANVAKIYPLEDVEKLSGQANIDLTVKTKKSDIDKKNYTAITALGNIAAKSIQLKSKDLPEQVAIDDLLMNFSPQYVALDNFKANILNSDFDIKGRLENFIGYFLSKEAVLSGNLNLISNQIDANKFLPDSSSAEKSKSQQAKEVIRLPKNVDFSATIQIGKLLYDQLVFEKLSGNTNLKNEQLDINKLSANLLGGNAVISGFYNTQTDIPTAKLNYMIHNFDVQQTYKYVNSAQKALPVMKFINGNFNSDMNITANLYPDLSPNLNSLNGNAGFKMPWANIEGADILNKIAATTKLSQLQKLKLENIDIKTTFVNGRILIEPFTVKSDKLNLTVGGSQGLDETMDYSISIDVPWEELNQEATSFAKNLLAKNPVPQLNNAIPEVIRINLNLTGTFKNPKISLGKPDGKIGSGTMKDVVKEQAQQQIQNIKEEAVLVKEELKEQAKQTLDTLKTQAKEQTLKTLNNLISGEKNDTTKSDNPVETLKNSGENIKDALKNKLPWKK